MRSPTYLFLPLALAFSVNSEATQLISDISRISRYWGHLSPYADNSDDHFGVEYAGLPEGCQIESVQTLQRHTERLPTSGYEDGGNINRFARKISDFSTQSNDLFEGELGFLNSWQNLVSKGDLLTGSGAVSQFAAGVKFWNEYGRILFNASSGQVAYDPNFPNGTSRPTVVLRTTDQSRIHNSQINWALGFFGATRQQDPNSSFLNITQSYEVVIIPEEAPGKWNNTLASYVSCSNFYKIEIGYLGERIQANYISKYLAGATERIQNLVPDGLILTPKDVHAMQLLCAYETALIGVSKFCGLFSEDEWAGFETSLDILYYYTFGQGNPTGRAQGIGYVHEMFARMNHSLIYSSSTSVNSTLNSNSATFPTDQSFYADFTHDDILISTLAALSIDYFHAPPNITEYPPDPNRKFVLSHITPFGARLITETIGCTSPNPKPSRYARVQYKTGQYGYEPSAATHKFVRMRLNNGIVPLNTIRSGVCGDESTGRIDGMCAVKDFLRNEETVTHLANYQYACFANYTFNDVDSGIDYDGTIFP